MYSKFGRKLRIVENYKFQLHKLLEVCMKKRCSGAYMKIQHGVVIAESHKHNHEPPSKL